MTDFIFLLIAVQNSLPRSMNWQSGVLINDFSRHAFTVSSGSEMLRIAEQSWLRGCVTVIRLYLVVKRFPAEKLAQMNFPH